MTVQFYAVAGTISEDCAKFVTGSRHLVSVGADRAHAPRGHASSDALRHGFKAGRGASGATFPRGAWERSASSHIGSGQTRKACTAVVSCPPSTSRCSPWLRPWPIRSKLSSPN
ncbi:hypothetical protein PflCFBP13510_27300 [Pseudomonas fluorescens]|nr:hypothetical protein PflCFBP13510_27300 [Pseudomonas fluorescens]